MDEIEKKFIIPGVKGSMKTTTLRKSTKQGKSKYYT